jgi:hypothetical protein
MPKCWTTDADEIDYENYRALSDTSGQYMVREFGLDNPWPIMVTRRDTGAPFVLFQSGSKFYFWNEVEGSV